VLTPRRRSASIRLRPSSLGPTVQRPFFAQFGDLFCAITQLRQHFGGVLARQRGSGNLGREARELDRAADRKVAAAVLLLHLDHAAAGAQGRIVGNFLHGEHRRAGHLELAQDVDRLELGLVGQPLTVGGPSQKPVVEAAPPAHCATFSYTLRSA